MPQVFQVLRCYKCLVFQVHQTKKSNKWQCKMCGEKQSVKRHYGIGSGKDCRIHVQKLNTMRGDTEELSQNIEDSDQGSSSTEEMCKEEIPIQNLTKVNIKSSKWSAFIEESHEELEHCDDSDLENAKHIAIHPCEPKYNRNKQNKRRRISTSLSDCGDLEIKTENNLSHNQPNVGTNKDENVRINRHINLNQFANENLWRNQMHSTIISNESYFDSKSSHLNLIEKCFQKDNFNKVIKNTENKTDSTTANVPKVKNSKWASYIDEEQLSNTSNEVLTQDEVNFLQGSDVLKENNKKLNLTKNEYINKQPIKSRSPDFECFENNLSQDTISHKENTDIDSKMKCTENLNKEAPANIFSFCDENDLDNILDF